MSPIEPPSSLEIRLKRQIAATGPIDIASYMTICLTDPKDGYYRKGAPIGAQGDFITAPEISQMFGELIGFWFLSVWQQSGRPSPFHLVELGPGRGTLMRDMMRAIATDSQAAEALSVHLVEIGDALRKEQAKTLAAHQSSVQWHATIDTLPQAPLFMVGNEFLDCIPIHQWVMHERRWHERVVGLNKQGELEFGLGAVRDVELPNHTVDDGAIKELSPAAEAVISHITGHLSSYGGAGLLIDYGYLESGYGDTFQAIQNQQYADPLQHPGAADLTAHVNFAKIAECARQASLQAAKLKVPDPVTQAEFLLAMGLLERAGQLGAGKSTKEQNAIRDAVERLAAPEQMGELFKVLALLPRDISIPPFD